jgi:hypothetical protein
MGLPVTVDEAPRIRRSADLGQLLAHRMEERYVDRIRRYCEANGIAIPIGFRDAAQRYAVIDLSGPPKLIARTWFNQADVVYYIERLVVEVGRSGLRRGARFM